MSASTISELQCTFPKSGELVWIGIRPWRQQPMLSVTEVFADRTIGLIGDRYKVSDGKRQVTLIQFEHLTVLESLTGKTVAPSLLRRNLVIKGINLLALKNQSFQIGEAAFRATGLCHPCSRIEEALGPGGYNAMRGHGGITAQIIQNGWVHLHDTLTVLTAERTLFE